MCVRECPKQGDKRLKCLMTEEVGCNFNDNPKFEVLFYESEQNTGNYLPILDRLGKFCYPQ